jgi:hypothetical protein
MKWLIVIGWCLAAAIVVGAIADAVGVSYPFRLYVGGAAGLAAAVYRARRPQ